MLRVTAVTRVGSPLDISKYSPPRHRQDRGPSETGTGVNASAQRRLPVRACCWMVLTLSLYGCGDQNGAGANGDRAKTVAPPSPSRAIPQEPSNRRPASGSPAKSPPSNGLSPAQSRVLPDGRRMRQDESGGLVILPAPPKATKTRPSGGCIGGTSGSPGPPTPGIQPVGASRGAVTVIYTFRSLPSGCMPESIILTLARSDGTEASFNQVHRIIEPQGRIVARVPSYWRTTPDVLHASAVTRDGRRSRSASVRLPR